MFSNTQNSIIILRLKMAHLPTEGVSIKQQQFIYTGVDYFGLIFVLFFREKLEVIKQLQKDMELSLHV